MFDTDLVCVFGVMSNCKQAFSRFSKISYFDSNVCHSENIEEYRDVMDSEQCSNFIGWETQITNEY